MNICLNNFPKFHQLALGTFKILRYWPLNDNSGDMGNLFVVSKICDPEVEGVMGSATKTFGKINHSEALLTQWQLCKRRAIVKILLSRSKNSVFISPGAIGALSLCTTFQPGNYIDLPLLNTTFKHKRSYRHSHTKPKT